MTPEAIAHLSDSDLISHTKRTALRERETTVEFIGLLAEVDVRRLYLAEGYSSVFTYCTDVLRLSEPAAYARITAARVARRFPRVLAMFEQGTLTLTTIGLLAPHLSGGNVDELLDAAKDRSKREVERLLAAAAPQPDIATTLRRLPVRGAALNVAAAPVLVAKPLLGESGQSHGAQVAAPPTGSSVPSPPGKTSAAAAGATDHAATDHANSDGREIAMTRAARTQPRNVVAPLAAERHLLRVTISGETRDKLERAQSLLRHVIPDGNLEKILDRAVTLLVATLERRRLGGTKQRAPGVTKQNVPGRGKTVAKSVGKASRKQTGVDARSRRIPSRIRKIVWARDSGRCAFIGSNGRCRETSFLEFHHVVPFAVGGASSVDNLQLRCRAHNQYEADQHFRQR